jgi:hypothetical protein
MNSNKQSDDIFLQPNVINLIIYIVAEDEMRKHQEETDHSLSYAK